MGDWLLGPDQTGEGDCLPPSQVLELGDGKGEGRDHSSPSCFSETFNMLVFFFNSKKLRVVTQTGLIIVEMNCRSLG